MAATQSGQGSGGMVKHGGKHLETGDEALAELAALVDDSRQSVLATADGANPYAAMTAFVVERDSGAFILHLSDLGAHKRHLREHPACRQLILEPDDGIRDILQHRRVSIACTAELIPKDTQEYAAAAKTYLGRYPKHQIMFTMSDFDLIRLVPRSALLNLGFGRAYVLGASDLAGALATDGPR